MHKVIAIAAFAAATLAPTWGSAQALVTERTLSANAAMELATAALERCRADGYKVTITV
jgi:type II secretory pathway pseudopilin PulG